MNLKEFITEILDKYLSMDIPDNTETGVSRRIDIISKEIQDKYPNLTISDGTERGNWVICKWAGDKKKSIVHIGQITDEAVEFIGTYEECCKKLKSINLK